MRLMLGLFLGILFYSLAGFTHGMDKLGPNGGHIRMPGAFHTELLADGSSIKVWLLDINIKESTTKNSQVELTLQRGADSLFKQSCVIEQTYFKCVLPESVKLQKGDKLVVKANREAAKGGEAVYNYPLQLGSH